MRRNLISHYHPALFIAMLSVAAAPAIAVADHSAEPAQAPSVASQLSQSGPSLLQVTGTTNHINISASHADVLSVLKAIFEQSHQQFAADPSVNGDVTMVLNGQPFSVVLGSVCKQTFLRYDIDKNGIYQFKRDDQAIREGFAHIRIINGEIAEQLKRLGFTLVPSGQAGNTNAYAFTDTGTGGTGGVGGFGGGQSFRTDIQSQFSQGAVTPQGDRPQLDAKRSMSLRRTLKDSGEAGAPGPAGPAGQAGPQSAAPGARGDNSPLAASQTQEPMSAYDQ